MQTTARMTGRIAAGDRLPETRLAALVGDEVVAEPLWRLIGRGRVVLIGLPGAFTPVCTRVHVPGFVERAPALRASGFDAVVCIASNDPWTVREWARRLDPGGHLAFLSDGNLDFGRAAGLTTRAPELFLGECLSRFVIIASNGAVEKISVETSVHEVGCTLASAV